MNSCSVKKATVYSNYLLKTTLYILSALVENKPGVLFRVTNLFRARNFNIESITVGPTEHSDLSRMTITIKSDDRTLQQTAKQLRKLIDVVDVEVLDTDNTVFARPAFIKNEGSRSHYQNGNN